MHLKSFLNVSFGCFSLVPCKKIFKGTSGQTICTHKQTQTHTTTHTPTHTHTHTHIYDVINDSSSAGCSREQSCANVYMYSLLLGILLRVINMLLLIGEKQRRDGDYITAAMINDLPRANFFEAFKVKVTMKQNSVFE